MDFSRGSIFSYFVVFFCSSPLSYVIATVRMFLSAQDSCVETLSPKVMVLDSKASGKE